MTAPGTSTRHATAVIAHRGASADAPENTLAAVEAGLLAGSAMIECDVHRTADGALVVAHDHHLGRTTDAHTVFPRLRPWNIGELTLDQLRRLDAGSWFDHSFAGQRVPTLDEWLTAIGTRSGMLVEVKHPSRYPGIETDLAEALLANQWARRAMHDDRLVVQSFDHEWLHDRYAALADGIRLGALCTARPSSRQVARLAAWAHQLNPRLGATDRALIDCAHDHGMTVNVWTVDRSTDMRRLMDARADGIITNRPRKLHDLVTRHQAVPA